MAPHRLAGSAILGAAALAAWASPAAARRSVTPYIEVQQVIDADLNGGGDTLTYSTIAAGIEASIADRRASGTISYRYEYRIPWNDNLSDASVHSGLARGEYKLVPNLLSVEAGAIATRARTDIRGPAPQPLLGDGANISQVYGVYDGPTLGTKIGELNVGASYRLGYVKVEDRLGFALAPGQPRLDYYDSSTTQSAAASVGMGPGTLPFGWTVSAGWEREDGSQLDSRYDGKFARGDVTLPVAPTLALVAGIGYENIEISQRPALLDASGAPVLKPNGRFVTNEAAPRQLAFETDGLIYDGGVIWRPNRRTTLQARVGKRYGGTFYTGSLEWQMSRTSGLQIGVYNQIDSFGRGLTRGLSGLPTQFEVASNPFLNNFGGCTFGADPGTGACLGNVFQSLGTANFRSRGVYALYSARRGPWNFGAGGGYAQRKFIAPTQGNLFSLDGVEDESWSAQANVGRQLSRASGIDAAVYANWYDSGIAGAPDVTSAGATGSYYHNFGERLTANAALGIYSFEVDGFETDVAGSLLLGMRYIF